MVKVALWVVALAALFYLTDAWSADYSLRAGAGISDSKVTGKIKYFSLRTEEVLGGGVIHGAAELGGYLDNSLGDRSSSFIGKAQIGIKPGALVGLYARAFLGVGGISHTDGVLGGRFQFMEEVGLGVRDGKTFVECLYSHVSSAGLSEPNKGRDFVVCGAGVKI